MKPPIPALVALAALAACGGDAETPRWHVAGGHLRAPDGRAVVLRGVNVANAQKHAPYLDDSSAADWQRLRRDFGFNAVRFLMTWSAVEPERGHYDDAYLERVRERLGWAADAGLVVVLDMHQDVYGEGFGFDGAPRWTCDEAGYAAFVPREPWFLSNLDPNVIACVDRFYADPEVRGRFVAAWVHVAQALAHAPAVIGFDPLNEPVWGSHAITTFEADLLAPLYTDVVTEVRRAAPGWVAFLEPGANRNAGIATSLTPFPFRDVVYAPHSYDASAESGAGFDPAHRADVIEHVNALRAEADALGAALWIGEYGGSSSAPGIAAYMDAETDAFAAACASSMYWSYDRDGGYGFLDADGGAKPVLVEALVSPYPERVAGDPVGWSWDAAAHSFTFTYAPDAASTLPTEIVVPERTFPAGYVVDCGGCTVEKAAGVVRLVTPPPGTPATITLRP
jgi:endoglycosylceramidase